MSSNAIIIYYKLLGGGLLCGLHAGCPARPSRDARNTRHAAVLVSLETAKQIDLFAQVTIHRGVCVGE